MSLPTDQLIAQLSADTSARPVLHAPRILALKLFSVLAAYGVIAQLVLGIRPDVATQVLRPLYTLELGLLALLAVSGTIASILSMYPDRYQWPNLTRVPYALFAALTALVGAQFFIPLDERMVMQEVTLGGLECTLCIAIVSMIPAGLIMALLRKGATVHPLQAGALAVLTSAAVGGLTLRIAEQNDSLAHMALWHYGPTLLFAAFGALLGKWLLRW